MAQIQDDDSGSLLASPTGPLYGSWAGTLTALDGSYRLTGLEAARYNVAIEEPSGRWVGAAREGVPARGGQGTRVDDLVLTPGAFVEGLVVDDRTGQPVAGVSVGSYGPHRPRSSAMIISDDTDAMGRYRLRVAPGRSYVYVADGRFEREPGTEVVVALGKTAVHTFRIRPAAETTGGTPYQPVPGPAPQ
jgi:hypothetical protein